VVGSAWGAALGSLPVVLQAARRDKQFRSFSGLTPKASETGEPDRKDQRMSKAGSSLLGTILIRAADTAYKQDPQLAAVYHQQMTRRSKTSPAPCASPPASRNAPGPSCAAAPLTSSATTNGHPVTPQQAKTIITERWTVPAEVRARRVARPMSVRAILTLASDAQRGGSGRCWRRPTCRHRRWHRGRHAART
jgi:hypothetical protein